MTSQLTSENLAQVFNSLSSQTPPESKSGTTAEKIEHELEQIFFTPQQTFPTSWLNKCQEHWNEDPSFFHLLTCNWQDLVPTFN
ncbi:unnamed protein product [Absidia cylindrospora]